MLSYPIYLIFTLLGVRHELTSQMTPFSIHFFHFLLTTSPSSPLLLFHYPLTLCWSALRSLPSFKHSPSYSVLLQSFLHARMRPRLHSFSHFFIFYSSHILFYFVVCILYLLLYPSLFCYQFSLRTSLLWSILFLCFSLTSAFRIHIYAQELRLY